MQILWCYKGICFEMGNKAEYAGCVVTAQTCRIFGVTIDELIGYEAYLSKEQIQKIYEDLSADFATKHLKRLWRKQRICKTILFPL